MVIFWILVVMFEYVKFIDSNTTTYDNITVAPEGLKKKFQHKNIEFRKLIIFRQELVLLEIFQT